MKLTVGKKLGLGFGAILALWCLARSLTYLKAAAIRESQDRAMTVRVPTIESLKRLAKGPESGQSKGRQVVLAGAKPDRREAAKKIFDANWGEHRQGRCQAGRIVSQVDSCRQTATG